MSTLLTLARFSKDTTGISRTKPSFWWVEGDSFCTDVLPLTVRSSARTFSELSSRPCCNRKWQDDVCLLVQLSLRGIKYSYSYVCYHFLPKPLSLMQVSKVAVHHVNTQFTSLKFYPLTCSVLRFDIHFWFSYVTSRQSSKVA